MVNGRPLPSAADGKLQKAFAVRRMMSVDVTTGQAFAVRHCRQSFYSLPSATNDKAFAVSHCRQTDQIGQPPRKHSCLPHGLFVVRCWWQRALCRRWQTAKSLHIVCFFCFFIKSHNLHIKYIWHIDIFHRHSSHKQVHTSFHTQTRSIHHFIHKQVPSIISYIKKFHPYIK